MSVLYSSSSLSSYLSSLPYFWWTKIFQNLALPSFICCCFEKINTNICFSPSLQLCSIGFPDTCLVSFVIPCPMASAYRMLQDVPSLKKKKFILNQLFSNHTPFASFLSTSNLLENSWPHLVAFHSLLHLLQPAFPPSTSLERLPWRWTLKLRASSNKFSTLAYLGNLTQLLYSLWNLLLPSFSLYSPNFP